MAKIEGKHLWPALGAMVAATLVALVAMSNSSTIRISTLDLGEQGFRDVYIQHVDRDRTTVTIGDRGDTTLKRGELASSNPEWSFRRVDSRDDSAPPHTWLARSETRGAVFFLPVTEISDWVYPYIYGFVRERRKGIELPRVEWTNVFLDRVYQGHYLRVALPFDRTGTTENPIRRRELVFIRGEEIMRVDTWFEPIQERYGELFPDAELPALEAPNSGLMGLSALISSTESSILLAASPPYEAKLMPLPIAMPSLYAAVHGRAAEFATDARVIDWNESWRPAVSEAQFLREPEAADLESDFTEYRASFLQALRAHGELYDSVEQVHAMLADRQQSGAELGLNLENP